MKVGSILNLALHINTISNLPLQAKEELFVPPDDVELAEGDVVIC